MLENEQCDGSLVFAGKSDCTECRQFVSFGRAFNALVSLIAAREQLIDNHIQAILKNSLVRLHSTPYSSRVEGVGAKSVALQVHIF